MKIERGVAFGTVSKSIMCSDLSMNAKCLYSLLTTYAHHGSRSWTVSRARLASDLNVSVDTVKRALAELQGAGVITRHRRFREDGGEGVAVTVLRDFVALPHD